MDLTTLLILIISGFSLVSYLLHMSVFTFGWLRLKKAGVMEDDHPSVSVTVIVAFRDEKENMVSLMRALQNQDYPADLTEVILVDDHSSDGSFELTEKIIREEKPGNFLVISLRKLDLAGSKKSAIETGIARAHGELIILTDADCSFGNRWLRTMVREYQVYGSKMLAGPVVLHSRGGFPGAFQEMEFLSLVGCGAGAIRSGMPIYCNGANMAFTRKAFSEVNGFSGNERYLSGDDVFLLHKIKKRFGGDSIRFVQDRNAIVNTGAKPGWKGFLLQRIRWASKARGYKDPFAISTAVTVLMINLVLFFLLMMGIFETIWLGIFSVAIILKMLADLPLMFGITAFARKSKLMWWFVPFEAVYILYAVFTGLISVFYRGRWKGRKAFHPWIPSQS